MPAGGLGSCVEGRSANVLLQCLVIVLIEKGLVEAEELRALLDDVTARDPDGDPQLQHVLTRRAADIIQATYATDGPADTLAEGAAVRASANRGDSPGAGNGGA